MVLAQQLQTVPVGGDGIETVEMRRPVAGDETVPPGPSAQAEKASAAATSASPPPADRRRSMWWVAIASPVDTRMMSHTISFSYSVRTRSLRVSAV